MGGRPSDFCIMSQICNLQTPNLGVLVRMSECYTGASTESLLGANYLVCPSAIELGYQQLKKM